MTVDPRDEGGDPACWLHLFEDDAEELAGATAPADDAGVVPPATEPGRPEVEPEAATEPPERSDEV